VAPFKKSHLIENEIEYNALEKKIFLIDAKPFAQKKEKKQPDARTHILSLPHDDYTLKPNSGQSHCSTFTLEKK
jgi:hypothetical protein